MDEYIEIRIPRLAGLHIESLIAERLKDAEQHRARLIEEGIDPDHAAVMAIDPYSVWAYERAQTALTEALMAEPAR